MVPNSFMSSNQYKQERTVFCGGQSAVAEVGVKEYVMYKSLATVKSSGGMRTALVASSGMSNGEYSRGIIAGGEHGVEQGDGSFIPTLLDSIDFINMLTSSESKFYGTLSTIREFAGSTSNGINGRGVTVGGFITFPDNDGSPDLGTDTLEYISITSGVPAINTFTMSSVLATSGVTSNGVEGSGFSIAGGSTNNIGATLSTKTRFNINSLGILEEFGSISIPRNFTSATSNSGGGRGIIVGGYSDDHTTPISSVEWFSLVTQASIGTYSDLSTARSSTSAASNAAGDTGLIAGGYYAPTGTHTDSITSITISNGSSMNVFGSFTSGRYGMAPCSTQV